MTNHTSKMVSAEFTTRGSAGVAQVSAAVPVDRPNALAKPAEEPVLVRARVRARARVRVRVRVS